MDPFQSTSQNIIKFWVLLNGMLILKLKNLNCKIFILCMSFLFVIYDFIDEYHSSPQINWYWSETCVIIVNSYTSGQKCFPTNRYFRSGWVIRPITFSPVARQLLVFGTYDIRDLWWNLTESIWKRRLSCGLICIRFWNLTNSNQSLILNFSSKNWSRASF